MSMHKEPLTALERRGLKKHGLAIGVASKVSDSFRLGIKWAQERKELPTYCEWEQGDEHSEDFHTDCGEAFSLQDNPEELESWARFCIYCGSPTKIKLWESPEEAE